MIEGLKIFDMFGNRFSFEVNSYKTHRTSINGCLAIILYISTFILAFMFGKEVYERKLPSVYLINERIEKSEIFLRDLPILFKFSWTNGTIFSNIDDYFDFEIKIFRFDIDYNISFEKLAHTTNCNSNQFSQLHKDKVEKIVSKGDQFMCLDTNIHKNISF